MVMKLETRAAIRYDGKQNHTTMSVFPRWSPVSLASQEIKNVAIAAYAIQAIFAPVQRSGHRLQKKRRTPPTNLPNIGARVGVTVLVIVNLA
jgi:hypothetical protein